MEREILELKGTDKETDYLEQQNLQASFCGGGALFLVTTGDTTPDWWNSCECLEFWLVCWFTSPFFLQTNSLDTSSLQSLSLPLHSLHDKAFFHFYFK